MMDWEAEHNRFFDDFIADLERYQESLMPKKQPRKSPSGPPPEAFEGLDTWAADVAKCLSKDELGVLVALHRRTANDKRVSAANRQFSRKQAQALAKHLK